MVFIAIVISYLYDDLLRLQRISIKMGVVNDPGKLAGEGREVFSDVGVFDHAQAEGIGDVFFYEVLDWDDSADAKIPIKTNDLLKKQQELLPPIQQNIKINPVIHLTVDNTRAMHVLYHPCLCGL